ncbi:hypothetical protein SARC_17427, partial [Sphaeroforma arctica JP610]
THKSVIHTLTYTINPHREPTPKHHTRTHDSSERRRPVTDGFERAPSERQAIVDSTDTHNTHDRSDEDSIIKHVK